MNGREQIGAGQLTRPIRDFFCEEWDFASFSRGRSEDQCLKLIFLQSKILFQLKGLAGNVWLVGMSGASCLKGGESVTGRIDLDKLYSKPSNLHTLYRRACTLVIGSLVYVCHCMPYMVIVCHACPYMATRKWCQVTLTRHIGTGHMPFRDQPDNTLCPGTSR